MEEMRTPALRFRRYNDAWENRKLGELYTERNEQGEDSLKILSVSIHHGVSSEELDSESLGKKVRRSEDKSLYKHVYPGDFVLNMMRAWQGAIGVVKSEGMISPAYIAAVPSDQLYPLFMDFCLGREESIRQMNNLSYGVTDFRKRLYWDSFIRVMCHIPSVPEQEMITAFLTHLDLQIDLHQRKYERLQNLKSAMLEKMFPKDGADVPEVRFKGFTEPWEIKKLSEITTIKARIGWQGLTRKEFLEQGEYYLITGVDFKDGEIDYAQCHYIGEDRYNQDTNIQLRTNDVLITKDGTLGKVAYIKSLDKPATLNTGVFVIRSNSEDIFNLYIYHYLAAPFLLNYADKQATGGTIKHLNQNVLVNFPLPLPKFEEQIRIGTFLSRLDDLCTYHQRELKKIKHFKKAMLERMFI